MSLRGIKPNIERTLSLLAGRVRHLETLEQYAMAVGVHPIDPSLGPHTPTLWQIRSPTDFAPSATNGLVEAIASLLGADGVVYLPPANYPIGANYAVPANVHLVFAKGAYCTIANGVTLTINGTLEAGLYQIFILVGTGVATFAPNTVAVFFPQWWGAVADGIASDTLAIQAAIFAAESAGGGWVFFPPTATSYYISDVGYTPKYGLQLREGVSLLGVGLNSRLKIEDVDMPGIIGPTAGGIWQRQFIKDLRIWFDKPGGLWWTSRSNQKIIRFTENVRKYTLENLLLENGYAGVWDETASFDNKCSHIKTLQCQYGFYHVASPSPGTMNVWERCDASGAGAAQGIMPIPANWDIRGYHIRSGWAYSFEACTLESYHTSVAGVEDGPPPVCCSYFRDLKALSMDGINIEDVDVAEGSVILVHTCSGFSIDGIQSWTHKLRTGVGGEAELLFIEENSRGVIEGAYLVDTGAGDVSFGTGTARTLRVAGNSYVVVGGGSIYGIVGAVAVYGISKTGTGGGIVLHSVDYDTLDDPNEEVCFLQPQQALLVPRLTTAERNALAAINGMIIYNTTTLRMEGYENGAWVDL